MYTSLEIHRVEELHDGDWSESDETELRITAGYTRLNHILLYDHSLNTCYTLRFYISAPNF